MQASLKSLLKSWPSLTAIAFIAVITAAVPTRLHAQSREQANEQVNLLAAPPLNAQFQYATLTATTNTINATMVPVTRADGTVAYLNLTIPFNVTQDAQGNIHVVAGTVTQVPSPLPQVNSFIAGKYVGYYDGSPMYITLSGPGVTTGGATEWTIMVTPGTTAAGCTFPSNAMFYVGPLTSNPLYNTRLSQAKITSNVYSYGIEGDQSCNPPSQAWLAGASSDLVK